jgi:hypothetical protein
VAKRSSAPSVRLRLSRRDIRLMLPALRRIVAADRLWIEQGRIARAAEDPHFYQQPVRTGLYTTEGMRPFSELLKKMDGRGASVRIRVTTFELCAGAIAVRQTLKAVRHRHVPAFDDNHRAAAKLVLARLEKFRRRARRLFESRRGVQEYAAAAKLWRNILQWVRSEFLWCKCRRSRGWTRLLRWRRSVVDRCVALAADGLMRRSIHPPSPRELRRLVRRALRSARRRKTGLAIRSIITDPAAGADFLADFAIRNNQERLARFDMSARLSRLRERLAHLQTGSPPEDILACTVRSC